MGQGPKGVVLAEAINLARRGAFFVVKVKCEVEFLAFFVELDDDLGRERPARFGAEAVDGADVFVA